MHHDLTSHSGVPYLYYAKIRKSATTTLPIHRPRSPAPVPTPTKPLYLRFFTTLHPQLLSPKPASYPRLHQQSDSPMLATPLRGCDTAHYRHTRRVTISRRNELP
ncbi:hypothetical protein HMPREF9134_01869 [Porphyromonas catoniae F0037]|uniref:Uncharacterized protein n=1 Tax=Porphyromonas catoniae F0037 TaxID=1127696 RepID=L1N9F0_9PORP|nr:hypothetical protein HMPREF9134_01869 [Porphyromonas catoniae F0037]